MNGKAFLVALMVLIGIGTATNANAYGRYGRHGGYYSRGYCGGYGGGYGGGYYNGGGAYYGGGYVAPGYCAPGYYAPQPRVVVQVAPPPYVYARPRYYAPQRGFYRPAPYRGGGRYRY